MLLLSCSFLIIIIIVIIVIHIIITITLPGGVSAERAHVRREGGHLGEACVSEKRARALT